MNNKVTLENLTTWIRSLTDDARNDKQFAVSWFKETEDCPFSIVGGWMDGFSEAYNDLLYISKSEPTYALCVKIVSNNGPYAYTDFEMLNMPVDSDGEVDNTCIALELKDDPESAAMFYLTEWERIMKEHDEEV